MGRRLSDETKEKMRKSSRHISPTPEHRKAISEYMKNRIVLPSTKEKLRIANIGEKSPVAVLNNDLVRKMKMMYAAGMKKSEISKILSIKYPTVSSVLNGRSWKHIVLDILFM